MSAFVLCDNHIHALVSIAYREYPCHVWAQDCFGNASTETKMGRILLRENIRSVNARYPAEGDDTSAAECYEHSLNLKHLSLTPVEIIKLCDCYDYQTCETDDYRDTHAALIVRYIRNAAVARLPGYDDAAWELRD